MQDSLLECIKTFEKTVQFVFEYMCIIHEKAAALPGTKTKENFHLATKHACVSHGAIFLATYNATSTLK